MSEEIKADLLSSLDHIIEQYEIALPCLQQYVRESEAAPETPLPDKYLEETFNVVHELHVAFENMRKRVVLDAWRWRREGDE